jgi:hypothetical protein
MIVEIPRMKVGERQTIKTLISEETLLFPKYLKNEKKNWIPRIESPSCHLQILQLVARGI